MFLCLKHVHFDICFVSKTRPFYYAHESKNSLMSDKQCRARSDAGSTLFAQTCLSKYFGFVCVEVLRPSQPNWVMSSAVSLLNHTFTGQA